MFRGIWLLCLTYILTLLLGPVGAFAMEDIALLPKGVRALMLRQGLISEIGNKYSSNYQLGSIQFRTSRRVDATMIRDLNPEFEELVEIVNNEFPAYGIGDKIYLGDLIIDGEPKIDYMAPVIAYGVTNRYTMALAIPVVNYNVNISARHEGQNNIESLRNSLPSDYRDFTGRSESFSGALEDAYDQLRSSSNLSSKLGEICAEKNLRCLGAYQQKTVGDIQWIHRYLLHQGDNWSVMFRGHLNLPTGPEDDPDNLMDLPLFNRTYLDTALVTQYRVSRWKFHNSFGFVYQLEDSVLKRIPLSANDVLPSEGRKEKVLRKIGDTLKYEFNFSYSHEETYSAAMGMQKEWKYRDDYKGSFSDRDYSLLAADTGAELLKLKLAFGYSTIKKFMTKEFPIPLTVSYNYSDVVSGKNVERQSLHELSLAVMF